MSLQKTLTERFKRIFKLRFAVLYPAGIWALWTLRATERSLLYGCCIVAAGLLIRSWANGYAIKMDKLTTSGPYAFVRHPLYAGTLLMLIGFTVILNSHWWGVLFIFIFLAVYVDTMRKEERMLTDKFGDDYRRYRAVTPPLWTRFTAYAQGEKWPFAWERYWRSQEYKLILWTVVLILVTYLREAWEMNAGIWSAPMRVSAAGILFCALADIVITAIRKSRSRAANA
ncbi:MAG: isoprenylcysteine carboxylmethyltransferase family protein [Candidatus Omnitrophica bacterium]|nr:isoprenylcysteine carboxylmethyltransferase family protein [Candidatus Omnitrophota bacterium]